jgi:hypothetical protein
LFDFDEISFYNEPLYWRGFLSLYMHIGLIVVFDGQQLREFFREESVDF